MSSLTPDELMRIERIVDRFEIDWRGGKKPRIEEVLAGMTKGPIRDELLIQILQVELDLRRDLGEEPSHEEYGYRLPDDAETIRELFHQGSVLTQKLASKSLHRSFASHSVFPELPGYEVLEVVGRGAMGIVYKARHLGLQMLVAIKVILPGMSSSRFRREARLIAEISSPHVVGVHDFRTLADGRSLLVMEYVDGTDLLRVIKESGGALPEEQVVRWMSQVCEGMMVASEHGIIHRDLKPANILIDRKGRAKVADFGLARSEKALSDMTLSSNVMGTPHYMAPEQAEDPRGVDTRADIYSFGAAFYHALTGVPPFNGESVFSILYKHKTEPLVSPRSRNRNLSERVCSIIERCLAKSLGDRFPSFAEVRRQLNMSHDVLSPWDMAEDPELENLLQRYHARRESYLAGPAQTGDAGETYNFPRGRSLRIVHGNIIDHEVDAVVSSDTQYLSMDLGVSLAIRKAAGASVALEAHRYGAVRPGRAVVTSAGALKARFIFHGVTVGISASQVVYPSRDLISEIMTSCFYHADSLQVRSMAFPLLGTGAMGFSRAICLDTMFQFLARMFLHGLTCVEEARIVLFHPGNSSLDISKL